VSRQRAEEISREALGFALPVAPHIAEFGAMLGRC
jgi:hypothetical protein